MMLMSNPPWGKLLDQVLNHSKKKHRSIIIFSSEGLHFPEKLSNGEKTFQWFNFNLTARIFASLSLGGRYMSCSEMRALITEGHLYWQQLDAFCTFGAVALSEKKAVLGRNCCAKKIPFMMLHFPNISLPKPHTHKCGDSLLRYKPLILLDLSILLWHCSSSNWKKHKYLMANLEFYHWEADPPGRWEADHCWSWVFDCPRACTRVCLAVVQRTLLYFWQYGFSD